jgi:hypothetical protein
MQIDVTQRFLMSRFIFALSFELTWQRITVFPFTEKTRPDGGLMELRCQTCAKITVYLAVVGVLEEMPRHLNIHCVIEIMAITCEIRRRRARKTENLYLHICIYLVHPNGHAIVNPSRIPESLADLDFLPS